MALEERDREDLLRDGRNMPLRGECWIRQQRIVIGFRPQGQLSLYCGADPVFQFNAERELRRAYFQGRRFAADKGRLVELIRPSRGGQVRLVARPLDAATQASILSSLDDWLQAVSDASGNEATAWQVVEPHDTPFLDTLLGWLQQIPDAPVIASEPGA